jgi:chemotaxis protein CheX
MNQPQHPIVHGTEDVLISLCNSVSRVLQVATQCPIQYSGMVQRITKTSLKPDIGFSTGLVPERLPARPPGR